jgi:hypothetical protein
MSSVAFGALQTRREKSDSGTSKSEQPPGLNSYIDVLAALVPAEVLAIHALVIAAVTTPNPHGQATITDAATLRLAFWLLIAMSAALFILGRRPVPTPAVVRQQSAGPVPLWQRWEWQDWIRLLIPPAAFVGWAMLEPTSVWNAVAPHMSSGTRILIPLVGAVLLAAVTKALTSHADKKSSPALISERSVLQQALQRANAENAQLAQELRHTEGATHDAAMRAEAAGTGQPLAGPGEPAQQITEHKQGSPGAIPAERSATPPGIGAENQEPVPKWVYGS